MLTLARSNLGDDVVELQRQIDRERVILQMRSDSLVLMYDFLGAVLNRGRDRMPNPHRTFSEIFGQKAEAITDNVDALRKKKKLFITSVKFDDMKEGRAKTDMLDIATEHIDEVIAEHERTKEPAAMFGTYENPDFPPITEVDLLPDNRQKRIQDFVSVFTLPAFRLGSMIGAMDTQRCFSVKVGGGGIKRYERHAMRNNEGTDILALWQRVNSLDSYGSEPDISDDMPWSGGKKQMSLGGLLNSLRGPAHAKAFGS